MAVQETPIVQISLFTALKSIRFLETLKRLRFNGQLILTTPTKQQWTFYLYLGSIIYATGGSHPVRRWQRNLVAHYPQILTQYSTLQFELTEVEATAITTCWEYQLLCLWVAQQKITPEQAAITIRSVILEVLFDVGQAMRVTPQLKNENSLLKPLILIDVQQAIAEVHKLWQVWCKCHFANYSPNMAATIKEPEKLRKYATPQVYQILTKLLNGQNTLRDLAVQMKQDAVQVTRSLLPYIESGVVELISIPDLPAPVKTPGLKLPPTPATVTKPLIACVDDSPWVCQTMEALLVAAGYQFVGVEDALRSFTILLKCKPNFIFLDLVMPYTNGYEICTKLRKLSNFRDTPIVILTGNDGIVDQVRAKLVGASDFLSKPVDATTVLSVIRKHLKPGVQG